MSHLNYDDRELIEKIKRQRVVESYRDQAAAEMTQELSNRIGDYALAYPNMNAGVLVSLAKAGLPPSDPSVQQIANLDFQKQLHTGAMDSIGDQLDG